MIVGNPSAFAIESSISCAFTRPSLIALGYFVIILRGRSYGVRRSDATMLACSFEEVGRRLRERGMHKATFALHGKASEIADVFRVVFYGEMEDINTVALDMDEFKGVIVSSRIMWAPDGDAAFDDGSYVLQFDVEERVRIIAFQAQADGLHDPHTLIDIWLSASEFYGILRQWQTAFETEWKSLLKNDESY